jgi:hypothetical protein
VLYLLESLVSLCPRKWHTTYRYLQCCVYTFIMNPAKKPCRAAFSGQISIVYKVHNGKITFQRIRFCEEGCSSNHQLVPNVPERAGNEARTRDPQLGNFSPIIFNSFQIFPIFALIAIKCSFPGFSVVILCCKML